MYYPYFRGKQFELITIRECALLMAQSGFVPIIEPVKEPLRGLERTLRAICEVGGRAVVVVNPRHGDHQGNGDEISGLLRDGYVGNKLVSAGILLKENMTIEDVMSCYLQHEGHSPVFVHAGYPAGKLLSEALSGDAGSVSNIFVEANCGKLYRKHFHGKPRILLRDGFERRRNADHPMVEEFSDLHVTFQEEGMDGFGDFLIVGDDFSEGGGPAYAVAIHLTFIDPEKDDAMYVYHFVSDTRDTPTDPAGKFAEALRKLIEVLDSGRSHLFETDAIGEFRNLYRNGHFPGLGYVKKLSMNHHIETLSRYFS